MNLKKLEIIFGSSPQDSIEYLSSPIDVTNNNLFFREGSPSSDCSGNDRELAEQERRIVELIDNEISALDFGESILTGSD